MQGRNALSPMADPLKPAHAPDAGARPLHVALIMDGNGRWAERRGLPRTLGHRAGVEALKRTVSCAEALGVRWLTVFGFSTENWSRPAAEVAELMALPKRYFESDLGRLEREGVRVRVVGRRQGLSRDLVQLIETAQTRTAQNDRFHLNIAFNYGAQADITDAARRFAEAVAAGKNAPSDLDETLFRGLLATSDSPPPDLIVRHPASSASRTSCFGKPPMPNSSFKTCSGQTTAKSTCAPRSPNSPPGTGATAQL